MSDPASIDRFEELEAGRVLGDLDAEEVREWKELARTLGGSTSFSLELTAAAVESEFLVERGDTLPSGLAEKVRAATKAALREGPSAPVPPNVVRGPWPQLLASARFAWGIAAIFAILLVANLLVESDPPPSSASQDQPGYDSASKPSQLITEEARDLLARDAIDLLRVPFAGLPGFEDVGGELIWSDARQEGYMTLTNLPVNDPTRNQYQLWIVDPSRDEKPVDGGVFNVLPDQSAALIPIRNPVAVSRPQAFLITLEKPGGVVVSDQKVKVALAAPS